MSKEAENPFAFPLTDGKSFATDGMLLRDYFAAKAMQSLVDYNTWLGEESCAKQAYKIADAMLQERNETDKMPSEIKQERDQLIRVLQDFISSAEVIDSEHFSMEIDQAKELINKIKDNE